MSDERPLSETVENRLMGQGIYLESWEERREDGDRVVDLEYEVVSEAPVVTSHEVGQVVRTLLSAAEERESWRPVTLRVTSLSTDGAVRGTWRVEAAWFRRLHDDLSEVEFSSRVLDTLRQPTGEI